MESPVPAQPTPETAITNEIYLNEFVAYCCICFTPVASTGNELEGTAFWMTSCAHILCSQHMFPNGVITDAMKKRHCCPYCQSVDVSITPIGGKQIPIYLQDFLRSGDQLIGDFCGILKFQIANLARVASYYKAQYLAVNESLERKRSVLLKVKNELLRGKELHRENVKLKEELECLRAQLQRGGNCSQNQDQAQNNHQNTINTNQRREASQQVTSSTPAAGSTLPLKRKSPGRLPEDEQPSQNGFNERAFREELIAKHSQSLPNIRPYTSPRPQIPNIQGGHWAHNRNQSKRNTHMSCELQSVPEIEENGVSIYDQEVANAYEPGNISSFAHPLRSDYSQPYSRRAYNAQATLPQGFQPASNLLRQPRADEEQDIERSTPVRIPSRVTPLTFRNSSYLQPSQSYPNLREARTNSPNAQGFAPSIHRTHTSSSNFIPRQDTQSVSTPVLKSSRMTTSSPFFTQSTTSSRTMGRSRPSSVTAPYMRGGRLHGPGLAVTMGQSGLFRRFDAVE